MLTSSPSLWSISSSLTSLGAGWLLAHEGLGSRQHSVPVQFTISCTFYSLMIFKKWGQKGVFVDEISRVTKSLGWDWPGKVHRKAHCACPRVFLNVFFILEWYFENGQVWRGTGKRDVVVGYASWVRRVLSVTNVDTNPSANNTLPYQCR